jgi:hypothetical protein
MLRFTRLCTCFQTVLQNTAVECSWGPQTQGAADALRDRSKHQAHAGHLHPGHTFVPASVQTYEHLGRCEERSVLNSKTTP